MENLERITSAFRIEGKIAAIKPLGNGLINDTFKVTRARPTSTARS